MSSKLIAAALVLGSLTLAGCNTVSGAGRDIQAGGAVISDTADDAKAAITE